MANIMNTEFGRIEVKNLPLPENLGSDVNGTYTYSGRVLVSVRVPEKEQDWYRVFTVEDDGTCICEVFGGVIPQLKGANGIRWMCFSDNKRVFLGDYVLEVEPDLDHCMNSRLLPLQFPEEVSCMPGLFMRWSEPIIAPDNEHVAFTSLTGSGAYNFLGRLVRDEEAYQIVDTCVISTVDTLVPDPENPGYYLPQVQRGGELKQFVRGGRGITLAGGGRSISESCLQLLDSEEVAFITDTLGYEETAIFSPDEKLAICMSPRFSPATDCGVLGVIPMEGDQFTRGHYLNVLYQYAIAGVRAFRQGNIGPALIDVEKSMSQGRGYQGVDLSDPEGCWVYYSPMSWHPDSTKVLWNERTRLCEGPVRCRLRVAKLLDKVPAPAVPAKRTPDAADIPYALPAASVLSATAPSLPIRVKGVTGVVENLLTEQGEWMTRYTDYSTDGETIYNGSISVITPANMFTPGVTQIRGDITVQGMHQGRMDLRLTLRADEHFQIHPDFSVAEDGRPLCDGYSEYDGIRREVKDLSL